METAAHSAQPRHLQPAIDAADAEPECLDAARRPSLRGIARASLLDCPLSPRQYEVVTTLMCGLTYKQAASKLGISPSTVRTNTHTAYERLAVPGSLEIALALSLALANGFVGRAGRHRGLRV